MRTRTSVSGTRAHTENAHPQTPRASARLSFAAPCSLNKSAAAAVHAKQERRRVWSDALARSCSLCSLIVEELTPEAEGAGTARVSTI